ncbi:MAG: TetR/AcrR family transcriptional regulator [Actinomycetota bacterium]
MATQQQRRTATRVAVIDAALSAFAKQGQVDVALAEIADDAGVAKTTVLYHFGSRAGLLRAVAVELVSRFEQTLGAEGSADFATWARAALDGLATRSGAILYAINDDLARQAGLAESDPTPYLMDRLVGFGVAEPELLAAAILQFGRQLATGHSAAADVDRFVAALARQATPVGS